MGAGFLAGLGCGDDTSSGGGGAGGGPSTGGNGTGGENTAGNTVEGGGGSGQGGNEGGGGTGAMGPGYSCEPSAAGEAPAVTVTEVVTDIGSGLIQVKSAPGAPERLFLVRQGGQIRIYENGALVETPFLDVGDIIRGGVGTEEGLLGLAFHPDYETNGRFFIHYSADGNGDSTVMEYAVSDDPLVANPEPVQLVLQHPTQYSNHNGGAVEFGTGDGFLYISIGDGGDGGDDECDAQNPDNLLGKIMRIDVDGAPDAEGYPAAAGNPDGEKWYHIGLRNPWRISFDACTDDLYIGDVGQNAWEEVDLATSDAGPLNFGWPIREGMHDFNNTCPDPNVTVIEPIAEYPHPGGAGQASITGGYVYRGSQSPALRGWYFYADYSFSAYWMLRAENGVVVSGPTEIDFGVSTPTTFGIDGNGEVYIGAYGGSLYRIEAAE